MVVLSTICTKCVILTFLPPGPPSWRCQDKWGRQYWYKSKLLHFYWYTSFSWKLGHPLLHPFVCLPHSTVYIPYCISPSPVCPFPSVGGSDYRFFVLLSLAFSIWHSHLICEKTILNGNWRLINWCLALNFTSFFDKIITFHLFSFILFYNFLYAQWSVSHPDWYVQQYNKYERTCIHNFLSQISYFSDLCLLQYWY